MKSQEHFDHNNVAPAKIQIGFWHQLIAFIFYPRHAINVVNDLQNELQVEIKRTIVSITYNGNDIVLFFNTIECTKEGMFLTSLTFMIICTFSCRIDSRHKLYKIVPHFQLTFALYNKQQITSKCVVYCTYQLSYGSSFIYSSICRLLWVV